MPDQPPLPPTTQDFSDHWGFYLLQAINRLDEKIEAVRREQERAVDALRQEIGSMRQKIQALHAKFDHKIDVLDAKVDQKLTSLQYWYWGSLVVIIIGFVTLPRKSQTSARAYQPKPPTLAILGWATTQVPRGPLAGVG